MKTFKKKYDTRFSAIVIVGLCLLGMLIGDLTHQFRYSEYRWIYKYGAYTNYILVFASVGWSFLHPFLFLWLRKRKIEKSFIWLALGLVPFLYIGIDLIDLLLTV